MTIFTNVVNRDNRNHLFNVNNNPNLDVEERGALTENEYTMILLMIGIRSQNKNGTPIISNFSTPMSSNEYPQTQSILIQDARYQFLPVDPSQDTSFQTQLRQRYQGFVPGREQQSEQQPLAQAPAQQQSEQQPLAQAPAQGNNKQVQLPVVK